jgi:hypothetical protein
MAWPTVVFLLVGFVAMQPKQSLSEGAFAFGRWGNSAWAYGSGYNYRTQSEAQIAAMNFCNQRGYNCAVRGSFRKTCFAIAVQDSDSGYATGMDINPDVANRQALSNCATMGRSCTVRETVCDNVSEADLRAAVQAEYEQYVQNWKGCFGQVVVSSSNEQITFCDYALSFPSASQDDRSNLVRQRSTVIAARDQELAAQAHVENLVGTSAWQSNTVPLSPNPWRLLFTQIGMGLLSMVTLGVILTWAVLANRSRKQTFTTREVKLIVGFSASLLVPGILFIFYEGRLTPGELKGFLSLVSFRAEIFGNSLAALSLGSWVGSLKAAF